MYDLDNMYFKGQINPMAGWECSFTMVHLKEDICSQTENTVQICIKIMLFKVNMNIDYLFIIFRLHGHQFIIKVKPLKGTFIKPASVAG